MFDLCDDISVTRLSKISQLWQHFKVVGHVFEGLFIIWQNYKPTVVKYYVNGHIFVVKNG